MTYEIWKDPVVAEVRTNREAIYESFGGDMKRYEEHLRQLESDLKSQGWEYEPKESIESRKALHRQQLEEEYKVAL